jgi:SnoaL-like protein
MTMTTNPTTGDLVTRYLACWNETDPAARATLVGDTWTADAGYVDPMVAADGPEQITATIGAVQDQFPGFVFTPVGTADAHHDLIRFRWGLGPAGAEPVVVGFDVVRTDASGRIASVAGFLDVVPG